MHAKKKREHMTARAQERTDYTTVKSCAKLRKHKLTNARRPETANRTESPTVELVKCHKKKCEENINDTIWHQNNTKIVTRTTRLHIIKQRTTVLLVTPTT